MSEQQNSSINLAKVFRAIRFAFVMILLGLAYLNIKSALSISSYEQLFKDMLGGKPLPLLTVFIIQYSAHITAVSFAIPVCAISTLFDRGLARPFYILGLLALVTCTEIAVLYHALFAPLRTIITGMSGLPEQ